MGNTINTMDVHITYEKLFEILRSEKSDGSLQKLDSEFLSQVSAYLELKKQSISPLNASDDMAMQQHETAVHQYKNAIKLVKEIYDRREKKIMNLAINKARIKNAIVDMSLFLPEEITFFDILVQDLTKYRKKLLYDCIDGKIKPSISEVSKQKEPSYLVIEDIPQFMGPDMQEYGPFSKGQKITLAIEIASMLIKTKKIEKV